ncbi:hypothetical protein SF123566_2303 [Shigella flexneri 1235-66]|nr:hypothetical protein SF123566_2303 [Shigella flexneri 1235-66]
MYTLAEFSTGKAWSEAKRENLCYFESTGTPKPESQGGETKIITITREERPFIAKEYPIGNSRDPFDKKLVERQIEERFNGFDFPNQIAASVCGPAAFFTACKRIALMCMRKLPVNFGDTEKLK